MNEITYGSTTVVVVTVGANTVLLEALSGTRGLKTIGMQGSSQDLSELIADWVNRDCLSDSLPLANTVVKQGPAGD
jgi:hypothetical protein